MKAIDTHQHLLYPGTFPYAWCKSTPPLDRSFSLADYVDASRGLEIEKTVFVECDVDDPHQLAEARHIQGLADSHPLIAGIVAACRPEQEGFGAQLDELKKFPKVKGLRRVLHVVPDALSQSALFIENVRLLPDYSFSFDLCVLARQLPLARRLVEQCPAVSFILDHCGVPDIQGKAFDSWHRNIAELARHPNVACKISGLPAYAGEGKTSAGNLRAWTDHVIASFGWDRVIWGGDWPVCTLATSLEKWFRIAESLVEGGTEQQRREFFYENAERVYQLEG